MGHAAFGSVRHGTTQLFGGYFFVWHSHAEKELTTFDIFPGGSLSAVVVLPPYVDIQ